MERFVGSVPFDYYDGQTPDLPGFNFWLLDSLKVEQSAVKTGTMDSIFNSSAFSACSAFIFASPDNKMFALMHVAPGDSLTPNKRAALNCVEEGKLAVFRDTEGYRKYDSLLGDLTTILKLQDIDIVDIGTRGPYYSIPAFDISFRPSENKVYVASKGRKDIQIFRVF